MGKLLSILKLENFKMESIKHAILGYQWKIHRKTPVLQSFFNEVAGLRSATLLKKRLLNRCFSMNFSKFFRTPLSCRTFAKAASDHDIKAASDHGVNEPKS